jgi:CubicO group peptidase (beta-lactamase class C family)
LRLPDRAPPRGDVPRRDRQSGTGGYASFIGFDPVERVGVIVLANSAVSVFDLGFHLIDQRYPLD